jgi:GNAT superfamily N-acetyltransferase
MKEVNNFKFFKLFVEIVTSKFSKIKIELEVDRNDRKEYIAYDFYKKNSIKTDYEIPVGKLSLKKISDIWVGMQIDVDENFRGRGLAFELMRRAVLDVGPIRTSKVFSKEGKKQMIGLVKRGYADELENGDFLIHFSL